jgi:hypothetical protein
MSLRRHGSTVRVSDGPCRTGELGKQHLFVFGTHNRVGVPVILGYRKQHPDDSRNDGVNAPGPNGRIGQKIPLFVIDPLAEAGTEGESNCRSKTPTDGV